MMRRPRGLLQRLFFATVATHIVTFTRCEMDMSIMAKDTDVELERQLLNSTTPAADQSDNGGDNSNGNNNGSVGTLLELHFLYLIETQRNIPIPSSLSSSSSSSQNTNIHTPSPQALTKEEIYRIEHLILSNIQIRHEDWSKQRDGSTITEIHSSPTDTISQEGYCAPSSRKYNHCYLLDGAMSIRIIGEIAPAVERFYNMTRDIMNHHDDGFRLDRGNDRNEYVNADYNYTPMNNLLQQKNDHDYNHAVDSRMYYIRSMREDNMAHYGNGENQDRTESPVMIILLVLLSIGIFCLTLAVIYLLYIRFDELRNYRRRNATRNDEENPPNRNRIVNRHRTPNQNGNNRSRRNRQNQSPTEGRLGITALDGDGMQWLEVKSTSSSASSSSSMSSSTEPKESALPKVVGPGHHASNSICCSSVSELSILSIQSNVTSGSGSDHFKLEKIEEGEEGPSISMSMELSEVYSGSIQNKSREEEEQDPGQEQLCDDEEAQLLQSTDDSSEKDIDEDTTNVGTDALVVNSDDEGGQDPHQSPRSGSDQEDETGKSEEEGNGTHSITSGHESSFVTTTSISASFQSLEDYNSAITNGSGSGSVSASSSGDYGYQTPSKRERSCDNVNDDNDIGNDHDNDSSLIFSTPLSELDSTGSMKSI